MDAMYDALDQRRVGIFESPTGTGKTLSILCAALTWLRRNEVIQRADEGAMEEEISEQGTMETL